MAGLRLGAYNIDNREGGSPVDLPRLAAAAMLMHDHGTWLVTGASAAQGKEIERLLASTGVAVCTGGPGSSILAVGPACPPVTATGNRWALRYMGSGTRRWALLGVDMPSATDLAAAVRRTETATTVVGGALPVDGAAASYLTTAGFVEARATHQASHEPRRSTCLYVRGPGRWAQTEVVYVGGAARPVRARLQIDV